MRWLSQRTPTVDGDRIYVVTARGELACLATADGAEQWRKDYVKDFEGVAGHWGYCDYPLMDGDHLICTSGGTKAIVVALDKRTGAVHWTCAVPNVRDATYSAVVVAEIAGVRQYVQQFDFGVAGIRARDGRVLWQYGGIAPGGMGNVHTAIPRGDEVFCSSGWGKGGALIALRRDGERFTVEERHRDNLSAFDPWLGNSCAIGDHLYTNAGFCIEWRTGKVAWRESLGSRITMVAADGHLYFRTGDGTMVLAEAQPNEFVEKGRFRVPPLTHEPTWTTPVIAGGRLYLRDQDALSCYDLRKDRSVPFEPVAAPPAGVTDAGGDRPSARADDEDRHARGDAIFVPTPQDVVDRMLEVAAVTKDDVVYDLGCGDGRIVVTAAARYGCRAAGYDIDPRCVRMSRDNVGKAKVGGLVMIEEKDVFTLDLSGASVVTLYMGRDVNRRLLPQLEKLKPGARVVSHNFEIEGASRTGWWRWSPPRTTRNTRCTCG